MKAVWLVFMTLMGAVALDSLGDGEYLLAGIALGFCMWDAYLVMKEDE